MPYSLVWMSKYLTAASRVLKDLAVRLDPGGDTDHGFPLLTTDDPQIAERFGFESPEEEDD